MHGVQFQLEGIVWDEIFSNSLIIHQAKTNKITTVKEVLIPGLN